MACWNLFVFSGPPVPPANALAAPDAGVSESLGSAIMLASRVEDLAKEGVLAGYLNGMSSSMLRPPRVRRCRDGDGIFVRSATRREWPGFFCFGGSVVFRFRWHCGKARKSKLGS